MSGKNGTAGALAVVKIAQIASWSCDGRSRAPISIGRPAAASNIVKRLAKLGAIIVRPSGVKSRWSRGMHVRPRHCARLHRHVARMIKSAESFSGQAASVETTISLRARRGCQRRYTGPPARTEEGREGKEGVSTWRIRGG